jgi:N-acyl-D-amino-acid deacylase
VILGRLVALLPALLLPGFCEAADITPSTLIAHARIVDGTSQPARAASLRIEEGRIAAIGELEPRPGELVIEGAGLVLAPGFIDTHSHHDIDLFDQPEAIAAVSQGITTIVVGQDGTMVHEPRELFRRLARRPVAVNVATYVGHGTIRADVLGSDFRRAATLREVRRMKSRVAAGMRSGALGLSTGLEYDPGIYATKEEVLALAGEAARHGGRYATHLRSEDRQLWEALDEAVEIGRVHRMPVQISHMKLAMVDWWGQADRFLAVLDRARAAGIDVSGDVYPYEHWQSSMTVLFPLRDFSNRAAAEFALRSLVPPQDLIVTRFAANRSIEGKSVLEIAQARGTDPATTLVDLLAQLQERGGEEEVVARGMRDDDVARLIAWEHSNICSDGSLVDTHPRGAGAFTRVLREYVRERGLLTLEEAIRKMTGAAALHAGIADRGVIRTGLPADLVLFEPDRVTDRATFGNPGELSGGVRIVWVNGTIVFRDGRPTGAYPGHAIRRSGR